MSSRSNNTRSASLSAMKQGKLNFTSSKRTASAAGAKKATKLHSGSPVASVEEPAEVTSEVHGQEEVERHAAKARVDISPGETPAGLHRQQDSQEVVEDVKKILEDLPQLNIKDPRWRKLFADARAKRNGLPLIHGKDQNQIHQILRVFDLNYDYGPCIGVTRLERWERAYALGLNPPPEIRDILLTREGVEQKSYSECVFYDEV